MWKRKSEKLVKKFLDNPISKTIRVSGAWSLLPDKINDKNAIYFGDFISENGIGKLSVFEMNGDKPIGSRKNIYGKSLSGEYIHLFNTWSNGWADEGVIDLSYDTYLGREKIVTTFFTISNTNFRDENITDTLDIDIDCLNYWLPKLFKEEIYEIDPKIPKNSKFGILYNPASDQKIGSFNFDEKEYSIFLASDVIRHSETLRDYTFTNKTFIKIKNKNSINEIEGSRIACSIERLFILLLGLNPGIDRIKLYNSSNDKINKKIGLFPINDCYIFNSNYEESDLRINLVDYKDIKSDLNDVIRSWFCKSSEFTNLVNNYVQTIVSNNVISSEFITLTEGIENFFNGYRMSFKRELLALIYNFPAKYIKYINSALEPFSGINSWVNKVVDTRVYYTHGNSSRKHIMTSNRDLISSIKILKILIRAFALQQLGYLVSLDKFHYELEKSVNTELMNRIEL